MTNLKVVWCWILCSWVWGRWYCHCVQAFPFRCCESVYKKWFCKLHIKDSGISTAGPNNLKPIIKHRKRTDYTTLKSQHNTLNSFHAFPVVINEHCVLCNEHLLCFMHFRSGSWGAEFHRIELSKILFFGRWIKWSYWPIFGYIDCMCKLKILFHNVTNMPVCILWKPDENSTFICVGGLAH